MPKSGASCIAVDGSRKQSVELITNPNGLEAVSSSFPSSNSRGVPYTLPIQQQPNYSSSSDRNSTSQQQSHRLYAPNASDIQPCEAPPPQMITENNSFSHSRSSQPGNITILPQPNMVLPCPVVDMDITTSAIEKAYVSPAQNDYVTSLNNHLHDLSSSEPAALTHSNTSTYMSDSAQKGMLGKSRKKSIEEFENKSFNLSEPTVSSLSRMRHTAKNLPSLHHCEKDTSRQRNLLPVEWSPKLQMSAIDRITNKVKHIKPEGDIKSCKFSKNTHNLHANGRSPVDELMSMYNRSKFSNYGAHITTLLSLDREESQNNFSHEKIEYNKFHRKENGCISISEELQVDICPQVSDSKSPYGQDNNCLSFSVSGPSLAVQHKDILCPEINSLKLSKEPERSYFSGRSMLKSRNMSKICYI